jgi:hypothetical protein
MRRTFFFIGVFGALFGASLVSAESLLLLPITGYFDNAGDATTLDRLYHDALEVQFKGVVSTPPTDVSCGMKECALNAARENRTDAVIFSNLSRLGSRWIFSSTLIKTDGSGASNQTLTALSIDDIGTQIKNVADSLVGQVQTQDRPIEDVAAQRMAHKLGIYNSGVGAGYLFPIGNSYGYQAGNPPTYVQPYSQLVHLSWLNNWELQQNILLNANLDWDVTNASLGGDLDMDYLVNSTNYSPFLGGGLGLHYVYIGSNYSSSKRYSGPSLDGQGGLLMFQNYNVHVMLRGEYQAIFNSDIESAFIVDVGITFQKL